MRTPTYEEIEKRIRGDLDLQDEDNFIGTDELAGIVNEAINIAEAEVIKLNEDYLLTRAQLTFVKGEKAILLPENIYAQKIREFIYQSGPRIFEIKRFRDPRKFYQRAMVDYNPSGEADYGYMLVSQNGAQDVIELSPPAQESGQVADLWYIRNANRIPLAYQGASRATQLATKLDLPECEDFIVQFAKIRCRDKEKSISQFDTIALQTLKESMVSALTQRVQDNDDEVPGDMSIYEEHA